MKIYIFGYLSLISEKSLQTTVNKKHVFPAKLKGYKRTWGSIRDNSKEIFKRYINPSSGEMVRYFGWATIKKDSQSIVNGLCIEVEEKDLHYMDSREVGYERVDITNFVETYGSDHQIKGDVCIYTYIAPDLTDVGVEDVYIDSNYINLGIEGAREIDKRYKKGFLDDYIKYTHIPKAKITNLSQVFWSYCGKRLYLLNDGGSEISLIHDFNNFRYKYIRGNDIHKTQDNDRIKLLEKKFNIMVNNSNIALLREVLSLKSSFLYQIFVVKNKSLPLSLKKEVIYQGSWITKLIALDYGLYSPKKQNEDAWIKGMMEVKK